MPSCADEWVKSLKLKAIHHIGPRLGLKPNGALDKLAAHGGCPVLVGSKWITNKWIGYFDQECNFMNPDFSQKISDTFFHKFTNVVSSKTYSSIFSQNY
jgi:hypothetical protein